MMRAIGIAPTQPMVLTSKVSLESFQHSEPSIQGKPTSFQHKDQAFQGSACVYGPHLEVRW